MKKKPNTHHLPYFDLVEEEQRERKYCEERTKDEDPKYVDDEIECWMRSRPRLLSIVKTLPAKKRMFFGSIFIKIFERFDEHGAQHGLRELCLFHILLNEWSTISSKEKTTWKRFYTQYELYNAFFRDKGIDDFSPRESAQAFLQCLNDMKDREGVILKPCTEIDILNHFSAIQNAIEFYAVFDKLILFESRQIASIKRPHGSISQTLNIIETLKIGTSRNENGFFRSSTDNLILLGTFILGAYIEKDVTFFEGLAKSLKAEPLDLDPKHLLDISLTAYAFLDYKDIYKKTPRVSDLDLFISQRFKRNIPTERVKGYVRELELPVNTRGGRPKKMP